MPTPTVVQFCGFDLPDVDANHLPGTLASASCSLVAVPAPLYATNCLKIVPNKTNAFYFAGKRHTFTASSFSLAAFYSYLHPTIAPTALNPIDALHGVLDQVNQPFWRIRVDNSARYELFDAGGALLDNTLVSTGGTWRRFIMIWEIGTNPGDWVFYIDAPGASPTRNAGTALFGGTHVKANFAPGGATSMMMTRGGQGGNQPPPGGFSDVHHSDCYLMDDVTDIGDAIGMAASKTGDFIGVLTGGQITLNSATPDCDEDGVAGAGDVLDVGKTWDLTGDNDPGTEATYTTAAGAGIIKGGGVKLDAIASRFADYIHAVGYFIFYKGSGMFLVHGVYSPREDIYTVTNIPITGSPAAYRYQQLIEDWPNLKGAYAPTYDAQGVMGFKQLSSVKAIRTGRVKEMWFMTLEAVPVVTAKPTRGNFSEVWRNKSARPV